MGEGEIMNLLYVSIKSKDVTGGSIGRANNKLALLSLELQYYEYLIEPTDSVVNKAISVLNGYKCGLSKYHIKAILKFIKSKKIDVLFCDPGLYGILINQVKKRKTNIKVISFFHNCEYMLYSTIYSNSNWIMKKLVLNSVYKNELLSAKLSDCCVFLTKRDVNVVENTYKVKPNKTYITPIVLNSTYSHRGKLVLRKNPRKLLFVGSYFSPNIDGLVWFSKEILPYVDYTLTIVGKGFENEEFKQKLFCHKKIELKGFVQSLDEIYENCDIVVQPVFKGSGMKTKTAECLMYGKPLITTSEGMVGYEIFNSNLFVCDTADEFIKVLNNIKNTEIYNFYESLHDLFLNNYTIESRAKIFSKIVGEL